MPVWFKNKSFSFKTLQKYIITPQRWKWVKDHITWIEKIIAFPERSYCFHVRNNLNKHWGSKNYPHLLNTLLYLINTPLSHRWFVNSSVTPAPDWSSKRKKQGQVARNPVATGMTKNRTLCWPTCSLWKMALWCHPEMLGAAMNSTFFLASNKTGGENGKLLFHIGCRNEILYAQLNGFPTLMHV